MFIRVHPHSAYLNCIHNLKSLCKNFTQVFHVQGVLRAADRTGVHGEAEGACEREHGGTDSGTVLESSTGNETGEEKGLIWF